MFALHKPIVVLRPSYEHHIMFSFELHSPRQSHDKRFQVAANEILTFSKSKTVSSDLAVPIPKTIETCDLYESGL